MSHVNALCFSSIKLYSTKRSVVSFNTFCIGNIPNILSTKRKFAFFKVFALSSYRTPNVFNFNKESI